MRCGYKNTCTKGRVVTDGSTPFTPHPLATRSVFWHRGGSGVALASHTEILSQFPGGLDASRVRWVMSHPDYREPAGKWLPGLITSHDDVGRVSANARLTIRGTDVSHERFWPRSDRVELPAIEAATRFRDALQQQVRNWIAVEQATVLTLTAGRDSRAVLEAAGLHHMTLDLPPMSARLRLLRPLPLGAPDVEVGRDRLLGVRPRDHPGAPTQLAPTARRGAVAAEGAVRRRARLSIHRGGEGALQDVGD